MIGTQFSQKEIDFFVQIIQQKSHVSSDIDQFWTSIQSSDYEYRLNDNEINLIMQLVEN